MYREGDFLEITQDTDWYKEGEIAEIWQVDPGGGIYAYFPKQSNHWFLLADTYQHKIFTVEETVLMEPQKIRRILELQPELREHFIFSFEGM